MSLKTLILATAFLTFCSLTGCESNNAPSKYEPQAETARTAIDTCLSKWKSGVPYQSIEGKPAMTLFDARWQEGRKLDSFEIQDKVAGSEHPQYKVRVKLDGGEEEVNEYLVVGIDPLLVFRDTDYRRASGL